MGTRAYLKINDSRIKRGDRDIVSNRIPVPVLEDKGCSFERSNKAELKN